MRKVICCFVILVLSFSISVSLVFSQDTLTNETIDWECIENKKAEVDSKPEKSYIIGLNGEKIGLELYRSYSKVDILAIMPDRFYYWENEIREVEDRNSDGRIVEHKIRIYWNFCSSCGCPGEFNTKNDPQAKFGDFAEIYDENDRFMGFVSYTGEGQYAIMSNPFYRQ